MVNSSFRSLALLILSNYYILAFHVVPSSYHHHNVAHIFKPPSSEQSNTNLKRFTPSARNKWDSSLFSATAEKITEEKELYEAIECIQSQNDDLLTMLDKLRSESLFFRLYSIDMLGSCEYLPQLFEECYSSACEIYPVEEEEVPNVIKDTDSLEHDFEIDGWARWDMPTDDYYDMMQFPESFTGYDGSMVWQFIHERICFAEVKEEDEEWKADFNKAVSGLHSMISAQVTRGIETKLIDGEDISEEQWTDPAVEFKRRLSPDGENPHALQNLYFTYMLVLSAVRQARDRILLDCDSGKIDLESALQLKSILSYPLFDDPSIDIASKKLHDHAVKDECSVSALWEARMRTRELMRIMNCVQCNKCKLHAKVSVLGISTALQVLLGRTGEGGDPTRVHRVELASLMNVMHKLSTAINYCTRMLEE